MIEINNSYYKIGLHNMVFMLIDGDWIHSTKPREEVEKAIEKALAGRHRLI
jgi:hypothetical protein